MINDDVKIDNYKNAIFKELSFDVAFTTPYQLTPHVIRDLKRINRNLIPESLVLSLLEKN